MRATGTVRLLDQRTPEERDRPFWPGMSRTWLLPLYDTFSRLSGDSALHDRAVDLAGIEAGQLVLDVGCGTGNLTLAVLADQPEARVTGLDPDGAALRVAARKARRRGFSVTLVQGYADRLPAVEASLDHVVSSLALHHLDEASRVGFVREAFRSLRAGGTITIVDFGGPAHGSTTHGHQGPSHRPAHTLRRLSALRRSRAVRRPASSRDLGDVLPALLTGAGFRDAREVAHVDHRFGRISFVRAIRP